MGNNFKMMSDSPDLSCLLEDPLANLPSAFPLSDKVPHAPKRNIDCLTDKEKLLAVRNALRYVPQGWHAELAPEFAKELETYGRIYCYRFRPREYAMKAYPLSCYKSVTRQGASIQLM